MPIATKKPLVPPVVVQTEVPKIQPAGYKGIVYDDNNKPLLTLLAYITGASWTVDYYGQVVGEHNDLREVDPGQPGTFQQYHKTVGMELRVESALTNTYDDTNGITTVTGSAMVYPFLVPNNMDHFVADAGDTQKAIFRVTQIDRKSFNRDSIYRIDYELVGFVNNHQQMFEDLESKVIRSFTFSKDRLIEGLSPTIRTEEYTKVINLKALYQDLIKYYFKNFYSQQYGTLIIPGQDNAYYDPFVASYVMSIVDTFDAPEIRMVRPIPVDKEPYLSQPQFWELLHNKDYTGKMYSNNEMGLVNKKLFNRNSFVQGLAFSTIDYVVYPSTVDSSAFVGCFPEQKIMSLEELQSTTGQNNVNFPLAENVYVTAQKSYPIIHEVLFDNKYVLSNNFYSEGSDQSALEVLVKDYMKGNTIDLKMLYAVTDTYRKWKRLEQFYYGPILMTLVREADRAHYSA